MPLFLWKKSYEIGIDEIDNQHRKLVGIINELSDAMMVQKGYKAVPHILEQLTDYIQFHFTTEEEIDYAIKIIRENIGRLRDMSPLWDMYKEGIDINSIEWSHH